MKRSLTRSYRRPATGFTLIELLVAIAIIAILAAILFPVFARARENARRSSCQSNLKQMGIGIMQYTQDYDEKMPFWAHYDDTVTPATDAWGSPYKKAVWTSRTSVYPYIKSAQVFYCPSYSRPKPDVDGQRPLATQNWQPNTGRNLDEFQLIAGYACNNRGSHISAGELLKLGARGPFGGRDGLVISLSSIDSPSTCVFVTEIPANFDYGGNDAEFTEDNAFSKPDDGDVVTPNFLKTHGTQEGFVTRSLCHLDGSNFLCGDGHVKWPNPEAMGEIGGQPWKSPWTYTDHNLS